MNTPTPEELADFTAKGTTAALITRPDLRATLIEHADLPTALTLLNLVLNWTDEYRLQRACDELTADISIIAEAFLDFEKLERDLNI